MLTVKENLRETIKKDGHPDRFVNQYEFFRNVFAPHAITNARPEYGQRGVVNSWGVTMAWPEGTPGAFPEHTPDKVLVKDIEHWRDYVKIPPASHFPDQLWEITYGMASRVDRDQFFLAPFIAPGIFEQLHNFMSMTDCLAAFYEYPDEIHDMIKMLTDWELEVAEDICAHLHPDAVFHHDDWGSQTSTFISPAMFDDFLLDSYKQIYKCYRDNGVELIIHHADSYCANIIPEMIEMGVDIWQGAMSTNNIPELLKKYEGQITIMSGIDSAWVDHPDWSKEQIVEVVNRELDKYTPNHFIPCLGQGAADSTFPEVFPLVSEAISAYNEKRFGCSSNQNMPPRPQKGSPETELRKKL